jgi:hypothetical protein
MRQPRRATSRSGLFGTPPFSMACNAYRVRRGAAGRRRRRCITGLKRFSRRTPGEASLKKLKRFFGRHVDRTRSPTPLRLNARMRSTSAARPPACITLSRSLGRCCLLALPFARARRSRGSRQDIVEVMRDSTGECHRFHLLRLAKLPFSRSFSASAFLRAVTSIADPTKRHLAGRIGINAHACSQCHSPSG